MTWTNQQERMSKHKDRTGKFIFGDTELKFDFSCSFWNKPRFQSSKCTKSSRTEQQTRPFGGQCSQTVHQMSQPSGSPLQLCLNKFLFLWLWLEFFFFGFFWFFGCSVEKDLFVPLTRDLILGTHSCSSVFEPDPRAPVTLGTGTRFWFAKSCSFVPTFVNLQSVSFCFSFFVFCENQWHSKLSKRKEPPLWTSLEAPPKENAILQSPHKTTNTFSLQVPHGNANILFSSKKRHAKKPPKGTIEWGSDSKVWHTTRLILTILTIPHLN